MDSKNKVLKVLLDISESLAYHIFQIVMNNTIKIRHMQLGLVMFQGLHQFETD